MDLTSWGLDTSPELVKSRSVSLGSRRVGYFCRRISDGAVVYSTPRDSEDHRYHGEDPWYELSFEGPGYGLSIDLFKRLHAAGVGAVYVVETGTGDVYHFGFQQFVDGDPINFGEEASGRGYEKDRQMVVSLSDAVEVWEGHASSLYKPQPATR